MKTNYNLPRTREDKIKLIKALMAGRVTIDELREKEYQVNINTSGLCDWPIESDRNSKDYYVTLDLSK